MKESLWGYYLVLLGLTVSSVMIMTTNMTTTNQQDYYLLREVTNAAMVDAVDFSYYRTYGEIKINREKFVENFVRRFGQAVSKNNSYKIDFYSLYENPPSVSIKVSSSTGDYNISGNTTNIDVINSIDAILEANNSMVHTGIFYSIPYDSCTEIKIKDADDFCKISTEAKFETGTYYEQVIEKFKTRVEAAGKTFDANNIKILNAEFLKKMTTADEIRIYREQFDNTYDYEDNYNVTPGSMRAENFLVSDLKDVKFTVNDGSEGKVLSWSGKFKCANSYDESVGIRKYRYDPEIKYGLITSSNFTRYNNDYGTDYSLYSDTEQTNYEYTPYYKTCLIGIKYKIDFYYDVTG